MPVADRTLHWQAEFLDSCPDCIDITGENANVCSQRTARRQIRALIEKKFPPFPTKCGETAITPLELESERGVEGKRSIEVLDHHLDYELISWLRS